MGIIEDKLSTVIGEYETKICDLNNIIGDLKKENNEANNECSKKCILWNSIVFMFFWS